MPNLMQASGSKSYLIVLVYLYLEALSITISRLADNYRARLALDSLIMNSYEAYYLGLSFNMNVDINVFI